MDLHHIEDMLGQHDNSSDSEDDSSNDEIDVRELVTYLKSMKSTPMVSTLRQLALFSIVENIHFWMEYLPKNAFNYLYVISPFDKLVTNDILELIKRLVQVKKFAVEQLNLFFTNRLRKMDFNIISNYVVNDKCFEVMFNRCKNIKDLQISSKVHISTKTLSQIPVKYPYIEYLSIGCMRSTVENIKHCKSLKVLALQYCGNITDYEIAQNLENCKSLQSLKLNNTKELTLSSLDKLLRYLKELTELSLEASTVNFAKLSQTASYTNIKVLDLFWSHITNHGVHMVVMAMPNIVDFSVGNCKNLTTACFKTICKLTNLQSLKACYMTSQGSTFEFDTNVEYCLIKIGYNLRVLDFSGMTNVSMSTLAQCSPSLRGLHLNHCCRPRINYVTGIDYTMEQFHHIPRDKTMFSFLEVCHKIEVLSFSCMHLNVGDLATLFTGGQRLRMLRFLPWNSNDAESTNEIFNAFFSQFYFDSLLEIDLTNANAVDLNLALHILKLYPHLQRLVLVNCDLVEQEMKLLKHIMTQAGSPMKIEVSCGHKKVSRVL